MVDGINGPAMDCGTYIHADHAALIDELMILPGDYPTDGFTQVNPWADGPSSTTGYKVGRSDPYHEFQGGDTSAISIILQDECSEGYTAVANNNSSSGNNWNSGGNAGTCGAPLWNALPTTEWHYGLSASNSLTAEWKTNYDSYMELHQYGWDVNGNPGAVPRPVTTKVVVYAGSAMAPSSSYPDSKRDFHYHLYQAIGGGKGEVDAYGHIQCSDYVPVPAVFDYQCWAATDPSIPNMYMGASGGGDPTHTTGYLGGSLSNYDISFKIPEIIIQDLDSDELYNVWVEYLSDC